MQVIYERCCGLDVHKRTITACGLKWLGSDWQKEIRQFGTMTKEPAGALGLADARRLHARGDGIDGCLLEAGL